MNNEKRTVCKISHKQSLGIVLTSLALGIVNIIPILGWIVSIIGFFILLYMWIVGLLNAINSKEKVVPIIGDKFEDWFKNI